jgi:hypothetical protein
MQGPAESVADASLSFLRSYDGEKWLVRDDYVLPSSACTRGSLMVSASPLTTPWTRKCSRRQKRPSLPLINKTYTDDLAKLCQAESTEITEETTDHTVEEYMVESLNVKALNEIQISHPAEASTSQSVNNDLATDSWQAHSLVPSQLLKADLCVPKPTQMLQQAQLCNSRDRAHPYDYAEKLGPLDDDEEEDETDFIYVFEESSEDEVGDDGPRSREFSPQHFCRCQSIQSLPDRISAIPSSILFSFSDSDDSNHNGTSDQEGDMSELDAADGFSLDAVTNSCSSSITWYDGSQTEEISVSTDGEIEKMRTHTKNASSFYTWDS